MKKTWSRKEFLGHGITLAGGAAAGIAGMSLLRGAAGDRTTPHLPWPWSYVPVEPDLVRITAHDEYYTFGCCYAGFAGILISLEEKIGEPFRSFPKEMMSYGGGGVKGWGTLCGALNGASAAVSLVRDAKSSESVINELMRWYSESLFPSEAGNSWGKHGRYKVDKGIPTLVQSQSGSPLCHVSVTKWCKASGFPIGSAEQRERCARLSGDVAAKAVELLNDQHAGHFQVLGTENAETGMCMECHGHSGDAADVDAKMDCSLCHGDPHK